MANLFLLSRKAFVMYYCFLAPIKTFFSDTCQMTVKSCVLHLFLVLQTGGRHIINILLASFFRSNCKLRTEFFFPSIYGPSAKKTENSANKRSINKGTKKPNLIDRSNHAWKSVDNRFDLYRIFKHYKSNRKQ